MPRTRSRLFASSSGRVRAPRRVVPCLWGALALLLVASLGQLPEAQAEAIVLRTGRTLEVESVRVLDDRLNVSIRSEGVSSRVDLPFAQIEPRALLQILDTHADPQDGRALLRSAQRAFDEGLRDEAAQRYLRAAQRDATLQPERDAGLAAIRKAEALDGVAELEQRVRSGADARGAILLAAAILDSVFAQSLTPAELRRVEALGVLARRVLKRDTERKLLAEAKAAAPTPADAAPLPPAAAPAGAAVGPGPAAAPDLLSPVRAKLAKADHALEEAGDPALPLGEATRYLEIAAQELLDGRRAARALHPGSLSAGDRVALEDLGLDLRALLIGTYLELADVYRQQRLFEEARARVRAVLILEPGNAEAWTQRRLVEDDLRALYESALEPVDPYRTTIRSAVSFGWYSPSPYWGACLPYARAVPYGGSWAGGGSWVRGHFGFGTRVSPYRGGTVRRARGIR